MLLSTLCESMWKLQFPENRKKGEVDFVRLLPYDARCSRTEGIIVRPFHKLQVSHCCQFKAQILEGVLRSIDDSHIENNVELVNRH